MLRVSAMASTRLRVVRSKRMGTDSLGGWCRIQQKSDHTLRHWRCVAQIINQAFAIGEVMSKTKE
jgi:hypothetical protein